MKHTKCYQPGYPRPQLVRRDWVDLNGPWAFAFGEETDEAAALAGELPRTIEVPFTHETARSGIGDKRQHAVVWYARRISGRKGKRAILHLEGADYETRVFVGGRLAGSHRGGYSRFTLDVTDLLGEGETVLAVRCADPAHPLQNRGKQRWQAESYACWYVQNTGLWKSVWMEYVDETHLCALKITPDLRDSSVRFDVSVSRPGEDVELRVAVSMEGKPVQTASLVARDVENSLTLGLTSHSLTHQVRQWSCEDPALYDVEITVSRAGAVTDTVGSYFGLREYTAEDGRLLLNGVPFTARLLLDQGYWPESGLTPPNEEALRTDIELCRRMGFNGVRKHQKIEDERFFYYADILGFTVWCEMPSNYWFTDLGAREITAQWLEIVPQNYNHPSLVTWVLFNESWGLREIRENPRQQDLATGLYYLTKSIDPMRPVVSNDGWVHVKSDLLTLHNYEQDGERLAELYGSLDRLTRGSADNPTPLPFAKGWGYAGQPILMTEFGGTHFARDEGWGYGSGVHTQEEFLARFAALVGAVKAMGLAGWCYTQITDVEQETNGLLTAAREPKAPIEEIRKIVEGGTT